MENMLSTSTEGEEPKSAAQVVGDVLAENTKKSRFLQNVGFQNAWPRSNEHISEIELEADNAKLRVQVADLLDKVQESEQARILTERRWSGTNLSWKQNLTFCSVRFN